MKTRLTLSIDASIKASAKRIAIQKGISVSQLVEDYFKEIIPCEESELSPQVKRLLGSVSLPGNMNYKKSLSAALNKKFKGY